MSARSFQFNEIPLGLFTGLFKPAPEPDPPVLSDILWTPDRGSAAAVLGLWVGPCVHCGCDGLSMSERAAIRKEAPTS